MVDLQTFTRQWRPRHGTRNPDRMDLAFWVEMVRSGENAWTARERHDPKETLGSPYELAPVWCFHRFGSTRTRLPDGSVVCVAGEHEDSYDPDFCIYNDVVVFRPDGAIEICGYPADLFPPTDFHTATLVGEVIWLIGSLGYWHVEADRGRTQVFKLDTRTFRIERVTTRGDDAGWLSSHRAALTGGQRIRVWGGKRREGEELVPNTGAFELDLATRRWHPADPPSPDTDAQAALARHPGRLEAMDEDASHLAADVHRGSQSPGLPGAHRGWERALRTLRNPLRRGAPGAARATDAHIPRPGPGAGGACVDRLRPLAQEGVADRVPGVGRVAPITRGAIGRFTRMPVPPDRLDR